MREEKYTNTILEYETRKIRYYTVNMTNNKKKHFVCITVNVSNPPFPLATQVITPFLNSQLITIKDRDLANHEIQITPNVLLV